MRIENDQNIPACALVFFERFVVSDLIHLALGEFQEALDGCDVGHVFRQDFPSNARGFQILPSGLGVVIAGAVTDHKDVSVQLALLLDLLDRDDVRSGIDGDITADLGRVGVDLDGAVHLERSPGIAPGWVVLPAFYPAATDDKFVLRSVGAHKAAGVASRLAFLDRVAGLQECFLMLRIGFARHKAWRACAYCPGVKAPRSWCWGRSASPSAA